MFNYEINILHPIPRHSVRHIIGSVIRYVLSIIENSDRSELASNCRSMESRFNEVFRMYDNLIVKLCFGYARTMEELEDLHQDTLINIWEGLHRYEGKSSLKTWIYRVTLNTCVSTLRKRHKEISTAGSAELYDVIDDSIERKMMLRELHEIISCLSPVDKAIVLLWLDEFSYDEISEMMGMPRNSVGTRLKRAKEKLKNIK